MVSADYASNTGIMGIGESVSEESLLVLLLAALGHSAADATIVAIHPRLWFLAGEFGVFILGWWAGRPSHFCRGHENRAVRERQEARGRTPPRKATAVTRDARVLARPSLHW